jgi:hypothetical protein
MLCNLRDNLSTAFSAGTLNKNSTTLVVLNRVEDADVCLIAGVTPGVTANEISIKPAP